MRRWRRQAVEEFWRATNQARQVIKPHAQKDSAVDRRSSAGRLEPRGRRQGQSSKVLACPLSTEANLEWPDRGGCASLSREASQTGHSGSTKMKADYLKFVRWSEEDNLYVGYCPDLFIGGVCHGKDERKVYTELSRLVEKDVEQRRRRRQPLPPQEAIIAMAVAL
jgi:hypothetical protein